jgi:hypothetical protein
MSFIARRLVQLFCLSLLIGGGTYAQQSQGGSVNGAVTDSSGGSVAQATVKVRNLATNLEQTATTTHDGSYSIIDLPIGTYSVTVTKDGFKVEEFTEILVRGGLTTTVNAQLVPGQVSSTVIVTGTPLLNQTDTTNGYTLGAEQIEQVPLGTGSFTQLAIMSPGVSADLLGGSGTNAGLGNQSIWANGQRDTSNSFSFNGIDANNLFNGKSTSQVGANRFVLSTGENFLSHGGEIQTSTSVYNAIGNGLPSAPPETIQELRVDTSMYDASQGSSSGAHIGTTTISGTNEYHGQVYEYYQTSGWNAAPFFRGNDSAIPADQKVPTLHYNRFGATLGGPIKKDKLFFFISYQGVRTSDRLNSTSFVPVPTDLTNDRSAQAIANTVNTDFNPACGTPANPCLAANQVDPVALAILNAKLPNGRYLIPSADVGADNGRGYTATVNGPAATFQADQANGNIDYVFSTKDHFSGKYFYQKDPGTNTFAVSQTEGFPQSLDSSSQVVSLGNTTILTPNFTWEQRVGFIRQKAFATTQQPFGPTNIAGMNQSIGIFGLTHFPGITIGNGDANGDPLSVGPAGSPFANAGVFQNQFEIETSVNWVHGRHTISSGFTGSYTQLNIINRNTQVAGLGFADFPSFVIGAIRTGQGSTAYFNGSSNRYYRARQIGTYVSDNFRLRPNLTIVAGLRWDWDGGIYEKNGLMSNFYPQDYSYNLATDTINNIGLVVAGNNKALGTRGVSDTTLTGRQWGFAPRLGIVWSPSRIKNFVVRASAGMYYDRGEYFSEFSPSAGFGFNGPFGVTLQSPFVIPITNSCTNSYDPTTGISCLSAPFGTTPPPPPPSNLSQVAALIPCQGLFFNSATNPTPCSSPQSGGITTPGLIQGTNPLLFGGYDPKNKLPYSENWSLDLQWQPFNTLAITAAYVGNHGVHLTLPIAFNQPGIATATNTINGQNSSYGYQVPNLAAEPYNTSTGGNTDLRTGYLGYSPNSVLYKAEGISSYNALQLSLQKRLSHGFLVNASYTWSHTLDEQSGLGLFFTGNDPLNPHSAYASSDFDRSHVFTIDYSYQLPNFSFENEFASKLASGWGVAGITVAESGQPYSIYDYSGGVASIYYGTNNFIGNPIVPLAPGQTPGSAQLIPPCLPPPNNVQPACSGPTLVNINSFTVPLITPGNMGVPAGDPYETSYGGTGRNIFRGPFQLRFDVSVYKDTKLSERLGLRLDLQAFNVFNHTSFDAPNNSVSFNPFFANPPLNVNDFTPGYTIPPHGNGGTIQHTLGSPRFLQLAAHFRF